MLLLLGDKIALVQLLFFHCVLVDCVVVLRVLESGYRAHKYIWGLRFPDKVVGLRRGLEDVREWGLMGLGVFRRLK